MKKTLTFAALPLLAATLLSSAAWARLEQPAQDFARKAAISSEFEIQSSKLALQKSQSKDVKDFAQQMIDDHTKASTALKDTLKEEGADVAQFTSPQLDAKHQALLDGLKNASGTDFDQRYLAAQKTSHEEAVILFSDYAENGQNESLKDFAENTLDTIKEHNDHIGEVRSESK
jgi:putative membrane protein